MGWDNITGDAKILPSASNANELRLESGKPKKIRLLIPEGQQPYSFLEHVMEFENIGLDGKPQKTFRTIRCPKTSKNPNAQCPICDGQKFRRRVRNASNCWDYDFGSVQKLVGGDGIWAPIATTRKMGVDVLNVDWAVMRSGKERNDTEYTATNLGVTPFELPESAVLFDIETEYAPNTIEEMRTIVESMGMTWEFAITLPTLEYPSLEDALKHVMPNGKSKDQTFEQMWKADQSSKGMINFLATRSDRITYEKACAQVILVNLGGANIDGVPRYNQNGTKAEAAKPAKPADKSVNKAEPPANTTSAQSKVDEINSLFSSSAKFNSDFKLIVETIKQAGGGKTNIGDFTEAELDALLKLCKE